MLGKKLTDLVLNITRKGWLRRDWRHPWDWVEYILFLFRYPRWIFRFFLWVDPPYRHGDPWKKLTLDQWSKYVDVYFGLERPVAEQHLSSRRIVQRKMTEWFYLFCLTLVVFLCWGAVFWQQKVTAPVRNVWPLEWIIVQYILPLFAFAVDWARYRTKYWQFNLRETHGTARWKRFDELKNKRYIVPRGTRIPGYAYVAPYNAIYDLVFPFEEMFRSRLFVGKPGSGKSSTFHANHLRFYARDFNTVAVDIKGELYQQAAHYYDSVYRLDFRDPCYSDRFNLIRDCRNDITFTSKIAFTLIVTSNKEAANSQNKYFYDAAKAVLTALILHLAEDNEHYPEATLNDLFYMLAGEYRVATDYDRQYFANRAMEWIEGAGHGGDSPFAFLFQNVARAHVQAPAALRESILRDEEARINRLRHRVRRTLLMDCSVQAKVLYLLYTFENECLRILKNSRDKTLEGLQVQTAKEPSKDREGEKNSWQGEDDEHDGNKNDKNNKRSGNFVVWDNDTEDGKLKGFKGSRWGYALEKLEREKKREMGIMEGEENPRWDEHINWEKEFPRLLKFVEGLERKIAKKPSELLPQNRRKFRSDEETAILNVEPLNTFLSSPEKNFEKLYHLLSSTSPTRPDYRDKRVQGEFREEGFFLDKESGRVSSFLNQIFRTSPSIPARQSWASFQSSAGNDPRLLGNITSTLLTAIECFRDPTVNLCFRNPTPEERARGCRVVDWNFLRGETPTALFLVMSAAQSIQLAPVVATIFSVIMEKLLKELNDPTGEKKLRPCYLQVDEGGNFKIPNIAEFVATCRGSAVCVDYSVQSVLQLNHLYGNDYGEMVKEVFGTKIFLPGSEGKTAELVAHLGGELTTRQRKIVDLPGRWLDREEDQEVKRHLIDGYEARTLARHLEALCLMSDEPAVRITFPPFARELDNRLTEPVRFAEKNDTDILAKSSGLRFSCLVEEIGRIRDAAYTPGKGRADGSNPERSEENQEEKGMEKGMEPQTPAPTVPDDSPSPQRRPISIPKHALGNSDFEGWKEKHTSERLFGKKNPPVETTTTLASPVNDMAVQGTPSAPATETASTVAANPGTTTGFSGEQEPKNNSAPHMQRFNNHHQRRQGPPVPSPATVEAGFRDLEDDE